ncbi:MAG: class I SAM-dependent rRNA methyltransferase [Myxococcales bacterium]
MRRVQPVKLELVKDLARHLRGGHPWIYRRGIERAPAGLPAGSIVDVMDRARFVARGYYDPSAAIAVRVLTRDPAEAVTPIFWRKRIARAVALRRAFTPFADAAVTDCVRLVHGEGDGLPGVVLDLYGKWVVLKLYSAGLAAHREAICGAIRGEVALEGIYGRDEEGARAPAAASSDDDEETVPDDDDPDAERAAKRQPKGQVLWGKEPPDPVVVRENGVALAVDVRRGQKTGLFLDQRENRLALRRYARGRRALNCFSYTGGFSVQAALGGAREVTSVDRDDRALSLARKNFELNGLDPTAHGFVAADVLEFLAAQKAARARYDLIVLDPPAYAKTQKAVPAAIDGYASLHRAALALLPPGGILATASCSARVSIDEFTSAVKEAAQKSSISLQLLEERRQPPDHPVQLAFPEGRYLKFLVFRRAED